MKKYIIILLSQMFLFCNSQEAPPISNGEKKEIQDFFGIKENVKEINTEIKTFTAIGKNKSSSITSFYKNGAPRETKDYENGKLQKIEPWRYRDRDEEKGWEYIEEFDTSKRLKKATKYNDGKVVFENNYKYDTLGNKVEEVEEVSKTKTNFIYNNSNNLIVEIKYQDNSKFWLSKKNFAYDDKNKLIKTLIYYYPEEKNFSSKIIYEYDMDGSLIKKVTFNKDKNIIETKSRKISYY